MFWIIGKSTTINARAFCTLRRPKKGYKNLVLNFFAVLAGEVRKEKCSQQRLSEDPFSWWLMLNRGSMGVEHTVMFIPETVNCARCISRRETRGFEDYRGN